MKRIVSFFLSVLMLILLAAALGGCNSAGNSESSNTQATASTKVPTASEVKDMESRAKSFWKKGKFTDGIEIIRRLEKSNSPHFTENDKKYWETKYKYYSLQCYLCNQAVQKLRNMLKDPKSLVLYGCRFTFYGSDSVTIVLDYGGTNSFGGMERDTFRYEWKLSEKQFQTIREHVQRYLTGEFTNSELIKDFCTRSSVFDEYPDALEAIVDGTANYG